MEERPLDVVEQWLQDYDVPPREHQAVETLDRFLEAELEGFIRVRLPRGTAFQVGSKGSTARGTQLCQTVDFDLAVVGLAAETYKGELNAALEDLRDSIQHAVCFQDYALLVFGAAPGVAVSSFDPRPNFDLWLGSLLLNTGGHHTEFVEVSAEQSVSVGLWYTDWFREKTVGLSPEALHRTRANIRLFKGLMKELGAFKLNTGGVRGIVAELLILKGGGEFVTLMDALYDRTICDDDGQLFKIRPQAEVASAWLLENPIPERARPHPFHNLLMHLDHGEPALPLKTNGWNWRVLATLAWSIHWMRDWKVKDLVENIKARVGENPLKIQSGMSGE